MANVAEWVERLERRAKEVGAVEAALEVHRELLPERGGVPYGLQACARALLEKTASREEVEHVFRRIVEGAPKARRAENA